MIDIELTSLLSHSSTAAATPPSSAMLTCLHHAQLTRVPPTISSRLLSAGRLWKAWAQSPMLESTLLIAHFATATQACCFSLVAQPAQSSESPEAKCSGFLWDLPS